MQKNKPSQLDHIIKDSKSFDLYASKVLRDKYYNELLTLDEKYCNNKAKIFSLSPFLAYQDFSMPNVGEAALGITSQNTTEEQERILLEKENLTLIKSVLENRKYHTLCQKLKNIISYPISESNQKQKAVRKKCETLYDAIQNSWVKREEYLELMEMSKSVKITTKSNVLTAQVHFKQDTIGELYTKPATQPKAKLVIQSQPKSQGEGVMQQTITPQPISQQPTSPKISFGERKNIWGEKRPVSRTSSLASNEERKEPARLKREGSVHSKSRINIGGVTFDETRTGKGRSTSREFSIGNKVIEGKHPELKRVASQLRQSSSSSRFTHEDQLKKREENLNKKFEGMSLGRE